MSAISDAMKKKGMKMLSSEPAESTDPADPAEEAGEDGLEVSEEEIQAMNDFENAASPEDKAVALKAFIKLC